MRMAPNIDREADYIRDKAKKDLLALLEGVSKATVRTISRAQLTFPGPWKEGSRS